jgi:hypothetical protein
MKSETSEVWTRRTFVGFESGCLVPDQCQQGGETEGGQGQEASFKAGRLIDRLRLKRIQR